MRVRFVVMLLFAAFSRVSRPRVLVSERIDRIPREAPSSLDTRIASIESSLALGSCP